MLHTLLAHWGGGTVVVVHPNVRWTSGSRPASSVYRNSTSNESSTKKHGTFLPVTLARFWQTLPSTGSGMLLHHASLCSRWLPEVPRKLPAKITLVWGNMLVVIQECFIFNRHRHPSFEWWGREGDTSGQVVCEILTSYSTGNVA